MMLINALKLSQIGEKDFREKVWLYMDKKNGKTQWKLWLKDLNLTQQTNKLNQLWKI
jgi:hypothetical protein